MFMKKNIIAAVLVAALGLSAFAQVSNTNTATAGLFGTDVDAYMNVNYWSTVEPEKFFAYAQFSNNYPYLGFAKDFGAFYWGTYFSGYFGNNTAKTTTTGSTTVIDNDVGNTTAYNFAFNNIFGFGNIGVKLNFYLFDTGSSKDKDDTTTTLVDNKMVDVNLVAGLSDFELAGLTMYPSVSVWYNTNSYIYGVGYGTKTTVSTTSTTTVTDTRWKNLGARLHSDIILKKTDSTTHTLTSGISFSNSKPADKDIKDVSETYITIPLAYKVEVAATEKMKLAFKIDTNNSITMSKSGPNNKSTSIYINPDLMAGITYDTGKKVVLNAGVTVGNLLPTISYNKSTDSSTDPSVTTTDTTINSTNGYLSFSSGLAIKPTKNLTIDCSLAILTHLLDNDLTPGQGSFNLDLNNGNYSLWNTINDILIYDFGFQISYKM